MARKPLSVIILNYGTPGLAIASAESVLPEIVALGGVLVVVDNASPDDSAEKLKSWVDGLGAPSHIHLVLSSENGGFAAGNNLGIQAVDAGFYALLNSDTLVQPGALAAILSAMRTDKRLGLAGPVILNDSGERAVSRFRKRTPLSEFVDASGLDFFYRVFRDHVVPLQENESVDDMVWISFACVILRREMIDELGLLDERYFMYFEDCAYGLRARALGWQMARVETAQVTHLEAKSSGVEDAAAAHRRLPCYYYASRSRYFIEQFGVAGLIAANLLWYCGRAVNYARILALRAPKKTAAYRATDIWTRPDETPATR